MKWNSTQFISIKVAIKRSGDNGKCPACNGFLQANIKDSIIYCPLECYQNIFAGWIFRCDRLWRDGHLHTTLKGEL